MEERHGSPLKAIDLSQSSFRGSGALYQSDRLTIGRTRGPVIIPGQEQVIEKIVHVTDEKTASENASLKAKLQEALTRLVLMSMEKRNLIKQMTSLERKAGEVFKNRENLEREQLKKEVERLKQMVIDKEREIQFVKEAEVRKSALQSGDLVMRLQLAAQENKRLQETNVLRITQINQAKVETEKAKEEVTTLAAQVAQKAHLENLSQMLAAREVTIKHLENELSKLKAELSSEKGYRSFYDDQLAKANDQIKELNNQLATLNRSANTESDLSDSIKHLENELTKCQAELSSERSQRSSLVQEMAHVKLALAEATTASEDLFRINQFLEGELDKIQAATNNSQETLSLKADIEVLLKQVQALEGSNLSIREQLAIQEVDYVQRENQVKTRYDSEIRDLQWKVSELEAELKKKAEEHQTQRSMLDSVN